jgi:hypothetical protein
MFDELSDMGSVDLTEIKSGEAPSGYQKPQNSYGGYNNNNNQSGGGGKPAFFAKKEEVLEEPYVPVVMYVDRDFPPEIKTALYNLASKLINKKITVRYNGDDKDFHERISALSDLHTEAFIPWKNFNEIQSKHYYNTLTSKHMAQTQFGAWDKIPDSVKALLARNVRMMFGDKNNSIGLCLVTWSKDGASRASEVNKDTGRSSFIIKLASSYGFPVLNIAKENAGNILERTFSL